MNAELTFCLSRIRDLESQGLYSNPMQYYDFLQNRVMIIFRPKYEEPDHDHPEFHLVFSKKQNYDVVCASFVAHIVMLHPTDFVLTLRRCRARSANISSTIPLSSASPRHAVREISYHLNTTLARGIQSELVIGTY